MTYMSSMRDRYPDSAMLAAGPRTVEVSTDNLLLAELLTALLLQLGYATLPPRQPDDVYRALMAAGLMEHEPSCYSADDLQDWQPCLLALRVSPNGALAAPALSFERSE